MSLLTKNGKLLTADGNAINQKGMTQLEVEDLINKKIIDLGKFNSNDQIQSLKDMYTAYLDLAYPNGDKQVDLGNAIFVAEVRYEKVLAVGSMDARLTVYSDRANSIYTLMLDESQEIVVEDHSVYNKAEIDSMVGAAGESLVIDMGIYVNDSTEEALKELFVSIKNKALPTATNYIYTAKVNDIKVKGMFDNISLKLDTNLQENCAEVKYEVYYDDEDNLLVNKWFVPTYNEENTFAINGDGTYFSISPDDRFIEFYSEEGANFSLSSNEMVGTDAFGNSYNINWKDIDKLKESVHIAGGHLDFVEITEDGFIPLLEGTDITKGIYIGTESSNEGRFTDLYMWYDENENTVIYYDNNNNEIIGIEPYLDGFGFGGNPSNDDYHNCYLMLVIGEHFGVGDVIRIEYNTSICSRRIEI